MTIPETNISEENIQRDFHFPEDQEKQRYERYEEDMTAAFLESDKNPDIFSVFENDL